MKDIKDIILERRIRKLEIDGKQVPNKYIEVFNSYLEQIAESLADHDKEVRKEALEDLLDMVNDHTDLVDFGAGYSESAICLDKLYECSDKLQGETK